MRKLLVLMLAVLAVNVARAAGDAPPADDLQLDERVMELAGTLRCLVCQNQTIADSPAELAVDLKKQIREKMKQGQSDREIIDYLVARYGDFVLYRPPLKGSTILLWFGPLLFLAAGLAALFYRLARRRKNIATELSAVDHARAEALLKSDDAEVR
ncbi:MAG TPA: cytochrome c-type biogenesis protein [Burkholderiales bacterium]|nr:cytochrome c-type biogenesis protein [Burkholderiales bacterium]